MDQADRLLLVRQHSISMCCRTFKSLDTITLRFSPSKEKLRNAVGVIVVAGEEHGWGSSVFSDMEGEWGMVFSLFVVGPLGRVGHVV
jgi:hypothetical protein